MRIIILLFLCGLVSGTPVPGNDTTVSPTASPIPSKPGSTSEKTTIYIVFGSIAGILLLFVTIILCRTKNLCMVATACDKACPKCAECACECCDNFCDDSCNNCYDSAEEHDNCKCDNCIDICCTACCNKICSLIDLCSFPDKRTHLKPYQRTTYHMEQIELDKIKHTLIKSDVQHYEQRIISKQPTDINNISDRIEQHAIKIDD